MLSIAELQKSTRETPLIQIRPGLFVKNETANIAGCFKLRSAVELVSSQDSTANGFVTASSGNTGVAMAIAGAARTQHVEVWMSEGSSLKKRRRVAAVGARVKVWGADFSETAEAAESHARQIGAVFVSPGRAGAFVDGHRGIYREIDSQLPGAKTIYVPSGGGGLLAAGVAELSDATHRIASGVCLVGVQAHASRPLFDLLHGTYGDATPTEAAYAECISGDLEKCAAIRSIIDLVSGVELVSRSELRAARLLISDSVCRSPELGALAGIAAAVRSPSDTNKVAILTGAFNHLPQLLPDQPQ